MSKLNGLQVKREITQKRPKGEDRLALLSGFVRSCFALVKRGGGGFELWLDCQTEFVRDYIAGLMMEQFKITPTKEKNALVYEETEKLLNTMRIFTPDGDGFTLFGVPNEFDKHAAYYVRGAFLGCGSMSAPKVEDIAEQKSGGYHLEFCLLSEDIADGLLALLAKYGIIAHKTVRSEKYVLYVKDSESVSDCLALCGAENTVIKLNEAVAAFAVKGDINRRVNCELANLSRTVQAAVMLADDIELIEKHIGLDALDEKLRIAALSRKADPEASLSVLAAKLNMSKSGLKHRLDKLAEIAAELKSTEDKQ